MLIKDFQIGSDRVQVTFRNSRKRDLYLDDYSGKAYYSYQGDQKAQNVRYAIYVGSDERGTHYFIQNDPDQGHASLVNQKEFAPDLATHKLSEEEQYPSMEMLTRALEKALEGEAYEFLKQDLKASKKSSGKKVPSSQEKFKKGLLIGGTLALIAGSVAYIANRKK